MGTAGERGVRLVRNMILARVLAQSQFGLMAIILTVTNIFDAFTEVGVRMSVIQNKDGANDEYLNVAWWLQAVRGAAMTLLGILVAPVIAHFYRKPELTDMMRLAFLALFFRGLVSPKMGVLLKQLKYGRAVLLTVGSQAIGTFIAIGLTLVLRNVWALVIGFVVEQAILCFLSHIVVPFVPTLRIHKDSLSKLLKFGRGLAGSPIMTIISFSADVMVLARMISDTLLGMYSLASNLAHLPMALYSKVVSPVLLPAFSKKQDERQALCRALLAVSRIAAILGLPFFVFTIICSKSILRLVYGPDYSAISVPYSLLSACMVTQTQVAPFSQIYLALGKSYLHRRFVAMRVAVIVCLMYPAIVAYGTVGSAFVMLLAFLVTLSLQVIFAKRLIGLTITSYLISWLPGLLGCGIVLACAIFLQALGVKSAPTKVAAAGLSCILAWAIVFLCLQSKGPLNSKRISNIEQRISKFKIPCSLF